MKSVDGGMGAIMIQGVSFEHVKFEIGFAHSNGDTEYGDRYVVCSSGKWSRMDT